MTVQTPLVLLLIVECSAYFDKTFSNLIEPFPDAFVAETLSLNIPANFF